MEQRCILDPEGNLISEAPVGLDETERLFDAMLTARLYDRKCSAMQRQGRLATYAPYEGQEAAQIGSAAALRPGDWMAGTYRDAAAMWMHGYPFVNLLLFRMGDERGGCPPEDVFILPPSITVGGHMIHAVGLAWASLIKGDDRVAITYFGDGATSEGDFHEAMNFAAVYETPTIFVCQNNQYAISMSREGQTRSATIAGKADAYGMPGVLVDGNDVLAMLAVTTEAVDRARSGGGPTLIEAFTYRAGPHTTTDDPLRYRPAEEVDEWSHRDPIVRVRRYLQHNGRWDHDREQTVLDGVAAAIEAAVAEAEATDPYTAIEVFEAMYAEPTPVLKAQRDALLRDQGSA
ncbi:pyruvate dehydrogenase (acetyl-transferring) E1 component subunit alpha [bacterium]|nr:pyruvate dehydrogenase (acetyl-transferring) E1 component subunit alpha [bacterium]